MSFAKYVKLHVNDCRKQRTLMTLRPKQKQFLLGTTLILGGDEHPLTKYVRVHMPCRAQKIQVCCSNRLNHIDSRQTAGFFNGF